MVNKLIEKASNLAGKYEFNTSTRNYACRVGCALVTDKGNIYTGISIDLVCGLGACAEYAAIAEMVKNKETKIEMLVTVYEGGRIIPPCGRCRELIFEIDKNNENTMIILSDDRITTLNNAAGRNHPNLAAREKDHCIRHT